MGWRTRIPSSNAGVVIGRSYYYRFRTITDPDDPEKEIDQKQKWETFRIEFRGMTRDIAEQLAEQAVRVYSNAYRSTELYPIGGGGYNVIVNTEVRLSGWVDGSDIYA